ncbi:MAG: AAA family ATPase [Actinobacteria bacterium]|nr:AAA family ATPase [Actinomycetota bacterium]
MTRAERGPSLSELGERICILGPSNSGKSTLAAAIGAATGLPVVHLDVLRFVPGSHWVERDPDEFGRLHDAAIDGERWVMEGNYSQWLPQRLDRATGLIVLDVSMPTSLVRYVRRTLFERDRLGGLEGVSDRLDPAMMRWIVTQTSGNRAHYRERARSAGLPAIVLASRGALRRFYAAGDLRR